MSPRLAPTPGLPGRADLLAFLRRSAAVAPSRAAVIHAGGEITYSELAARVAAVASLFPSTTLGCEAVAVVAEHDGQVPELYLGVLAAGHAVVPVSSRLPDLAIAKIAERAGIRMGVLAPSAGLRLRSIADTADRTRWLVYGHEGHWGALPHREVGLPPPGTAMVSFTSGTTGEPKGVLLTHENLVAHGITSALVLDFKDVNCHVNPMPLAHFTGASRVILGIVAAGTHVILPEYDPHALLTAIARNRGTHVVVVPTMTADLLAADPESFDLTSLETLVYGTAPLPMPLARELFARMPCGLVNGYGLTESAALATALDASMHRRAVGDGDERLLGSVGTPVPGVELGILDGRLDECGSGQPGQIALRGAKISPGYLANPEATAERFLPDGWLLTGDVGVVGEDHVLTLVGRIDEMIISGGLNVQPREIEIEALEMAGVATCAAFGVPSPRFGQEVHLAVTAKAGAVLSPEDVCEFLQQRLDRWKVPKSVHILEDLPRTPLGKVERYRLTERFAVRGSDPHA